MSNETDGFQWNDELIKEFVNRYMNVKTSFFDHLIEEFIASKSPSPVVERDFEILSFQNDLHKGIFTKDSNGKYLEDIDEQRMIKYYAIHSVRRLSDKKIFSIGDEVEWDYDKLPGRHGENPIKIESFKINDIIKPDRMFVNNRNIDIEYLSHVVKPVKKVLFVTEDGMEMFNMTDRVWGVVPKGTWETRDSRIDWMTASTAWKWFSSEEKRSEYILLNKPVLSVNDILELSRGINAYTSLEKVYNKSIAATVIDNDSIVNLAKQKINGTK